MSDLIDSNPMDDENITDGQEEHASWNMLVTMLLLIIGFLFASVLLLQQTISTRTSDGEPIFQMSTIIEKVSQTRDKLSPAPKTPVAEESEEKSSPLDNLKQMVANQTGEKVRWPRLKLTGFGTSSDGTEFARINGDVVYPGGYSGKVKLVEVRTHDVIVEYKGERKTLTLELED